MISENKSHKLLARIIKWIIGGFLYGALLFALVLYIVFSIHMSRCWHIYEKSRPNQVYQKEPVDFITFGIKKGTPEIEVNKRLATADLCVTHMEHENNTCSEIFFTNMYIFYHGPPYKLLFGQPEHYFTEYLYVDFDFNGSAIRIRQKLIRVGRSSMPEMQINLDKCVSARK